MEQPLISIIVPVYNAEKTLERCVDSILNQTYQDFELLLVDDGSPDACPEICERYAREYPGLVRVLHQENQGLGMARNAGAALAQGEYLLFLDSDDTIQPEMAQALYEKAKAGDCALVKNRLTGKAQYSPMGSSANLEGRTLAQNLNGENKTYPGVLGTGVVKLPGLNVGRTGLTESAAKEAGYDVETVVAVTDDKAHY